MRIALATSLLAASVSPALAQAAREPFETIAFGVVALSDVNQATFHELWNPKLGGGLSVATPFYAGDVSLGFWRHGNTAVGDGASDFTSTYFYAAWEITVRLPANLSWRGGGLVGSYRMDLTDRERDTSEQELGWGFRTGLSYQLGRHWAVDLHGTYLVVMTSTRIHHHLLGGGISRSFSAPKWLRDFLQ